MTDESSLTVEEAQGYIELVDKATPGEWDDEWSSVDVSWIYRRDDPSGPTVAEVYTEADGRLVAASRTAIPRLARAWLAEHTRYEASQDALREVMGELRQVCEILGGPHFTESGIDLAREAAQMHEQIAEENERLQTILRRCTDVGCRWAGGEAAGLDKPEEAGR